MNHEELCERARLWLGGSRRCEPVYSNCASCSEIPDAIGWASAHPWGGSTVVECKTSLSDFRADRYKYFYWAKKTEWGENRYPYQRLTIKEATEQGFEKKEHTRMGDFRFYMCLKDILATELIPEDHGLIYVLGKRKIKVVKNAPRRKYETVDKDSEIRFLRFAIINRKPFYGSLCELPEQHEENLRIVAELGG